jgi:YhcG PDDEXK nuclease domain
MISTGLNKKSSILFAERRALDRNVRKAHEQPAIGVLLCASKNDEVVEYALSRSLSPALIAEYQTQLPDKKLLQAKLHEFYLQNAPDQP